MEENEFKEKIEKWIIEGKSTDVGRYLEGITSYTNKDDYEKIMFIMFYAAALAMEDLFYSVQGLYNDNILSKLNFDQVKSLYSDNESDFILFVQNLKILIKPILEFQKNHSDNFLCSIIHFDFLCYQMFFLNRPIRFYFC